MPADSCPRCCNAYSPKYVSLATSSPGAQTPKTPQASCGPFSPGRRSCVSCPSPRATWLSLPQRRGGQSRRSSRTATTAATSPRTQAPRIPRKSTAEESLTLRPYSVVSRPPPKCATTDPSTKPRIAPVAMNATKLGRRRVGGTPPRYPAAAGSPDPYPSTAGASTNDVHAADHEDPAPRVRRVRPPCRPDGYGGGPPRRRLRRPRVLTRPRCRV